MNRQTIASLGLLLLLLPRAISAAENLEAGWADPPREARLRAYWWWLNGCVTRDAITRDLEAMKAKGFGGAMICDADGSLGQIDASGVFSQTGGPTRVTGKVGSGALQFDGSDDVVDLGAITTSNPLQLADTDYTIAVWLRAANTTGDSFMRVIDKSNAGNCANGWGIYRIEDSGGVSFNGNTGGGGISNVFDDQWRLFVVRGTGTGGGGAPETDYAWLYRDGELGTAAGGDGGKLEVRPTPGVSQEPRARGNA
jgi:hypothetical protein